MPTRPICLSLSTTPIPLWADHFEQIVLFQCDQAANRLVIDHHGAYNEGGDQLLKIPRDDQWNIRTLLVGDGGGINGVRTIERSCRLRDGSYNVTISGVTWNKYGSDQTAHITIIHGKATLFDSDLQEVLFRIRTQ